MNITQIQTTPTPIYEVVGYGGVRDFNDIIAWLLREDQPDDLSLSFEGTLFRFRTPEDRVYFALGFSKAFELVDDVVPHLWEKKGPSGARAHGKVARWEPKTATAMVNIDGDRYWFPSTCFRAQPTRFPRVGEDVEVIWGETGTILAVRAVDR